MTGREGSSSLIPIVVAVIGLITALVTSPLWGEPVCRAVGVCQDGGSHSASAGNPKSSHNSSKHSSKPTSGAAGWSCPGGLFCAWDDAQGEGSMIVQKDATCSMHDIGSAGLGDRLTSYQNRTGKDVALYNWTGTEWQLLVNVPDGAKGDMPQSADNMTDAVKICA